VICELARARGAGKRLRQGERRQKRARTPRKTERRGETVSVRMEGKGTNKISQQYRGGGPGNDKEGGEG